MGQSPTVVLGLGGCLDFEIVWATSVVQSLADRYAVTAAEVDCHLVVDDERDLLRSVLGFMRDGVGGERFVAKPEVVEAFGAHFPGRVTLGGTSLRAAAAMNQHGLPSTVHLVSVDDRMRALLPPRTAYISSADRDSRQPHLIVQYPAGARIILADGAIVATRANRLIYVNDAPNREMVLSPGLGRLLESADVFLVSGLNSVQDMDTLQTRLTELRALMDHIPSTSLVVFEDAGYHVPQTRARVRDALIDRVDVYSMNEDEMEDLLGHRVDLLDPAEIGAAALEITAAVKAPTIVVHTQYWSLAVGLESERFRNALGAGVSTASARYLIGDDVTLRDLHAMDGRDRHPGGAALARALENLLPGRACCVAAPMLSPAHPTTVGLGDAFVGGFIAGIVAPRYQQRLGGTNRKGSTRSVEGETVGRC